MYAKKLSVLAIAMGLGLSTSAYASNVQVPQLKGGFNVGVEGNYLRPTNSDLAYAYRNTTGNGVSAPLNRMEGFNVEPGHAFGFGVNVGYTFPGTGNDIQVNYNRLSTNDSNSITRDRNNASQTINSIYGQATVSNSAAASALAGVINATAGFSGASVSFPAVDKVTGKTDFKLDDFAVTLGQRIDFCNLATRLYGGIGYVNLDETLNITSESAGTARFTYGAVAREVTAQNKTYEKYTSKFSGIGPVLGLSANYKVYGGFGVVANLEAGAYMGKVKSAYNRHSEAKTGDFQGTAFSSKLNQLDLPEMSSNRVVPKLTASLGLEYAHNINDNYSVALEGGYKVNTYFNVKDRVNLNSQSNKTSNYSVDGPYLKLKLLAA